MDSLVGIFEVIKIKCYLDDGLDVGGGLMSVMCGGCVFEKVGVNVLIVFGIFGIFV